MMWDGNAVVYCEGAFQTTYGKTAHGLVRFTRRYQVLAVIDGSCAGRDAGQVLDGVANGIPILASLAEAMDRFGAPSQAPTHLVMGLAPDGGRLDETARLTVRAALAQGLNVDSGLHDFLSEDSQLSTLAAQTGAVIRDVRKPPPVPELHAFSGKIETVGCFKIAVLGTDSAVGKRTTAWRIVQGFEADGLRASMVGTGQTAWLQGARYGCCLDSLVNDFVAGEIEHAVWSAWQAESPAAIIIEGQGSLMNPAYPGGFEILAAGRPDVIVLQHAPARAEYDGFPGYAVHPLAQQIDLLQRLSDKPVVAVTLNHENMAPEEIPSMCRAIAQVVGVPAMDVLSGGLPALMQVLRPLASMADKGAHS